MLKIPEFTLTDNINFTSTNESVVKVSATGSLNFVGAGEAMVFCATRFDATYDIEQSDYKDITVAKRKVQVTLTNQEITYGDDFSSIKMKYTGLTSQDTVDGYKFEIAPKVQVSDYSSKMARLVNILCRLKVEKDLNYEFESNTATLKVNVCALIIQADSNKTVYGPAEPELTWNVTSGSIVPGNTISGKLILEDGATVGVHKVVEDENNKFQNDNYSITFLCGYYTIDADEDAKKIMELESTLDPELNNHEENQTLLKIMEIWNCMTSKSRIKQLPKTTYEHIDNYANRHDEIFETVKKLNELGTSHHQHSRS